MSSVIRWFELPAVNLERAAQFCEVVLGCSFPPAESAGDRRYVTFPAAEAPGGAIVEGPGYVPSSQGALVFFEIDEPLEGAIERVKAAGGRIAVPPFEMGEWGAATFIVDSEGNKVALHSGD